MRVAVSWLGEYLDLSGRSAEEIDTAFVRAGLEVEAVHRPGAEISGPLVIGRVLSAEELTGFKKPIWYCRVDVGPEHNGDEGSRGIVCGAPNVATAEYVVARAFLRANPSLITPVPCDGTGRPDDVDTPEALV